MSRKMNPTDFTEKWKRNLKNAKEDIKKGVQGVTESPMEKAAAAKEKMLTKLMEAIESGRWEEALRAVPLEVWKTNFLEKGVARIDKGVEGATDKVRKFAEWLGPRLEAAKNKIKDMPSTTLDDNIERMATHAREMAKEKYKKRG